MQLSSLLSKPSFFLQECEPGDVVRLDLSSAVMRRNIRGQRTSSLVPPAALLHIWVKYSQLDSAVQAVHHRGGGCNVYAAVTLIVAGIYRAAVPPGGIPALVCRFMGDPQVLLLPRLVFGRWPRHGRSLIKATQNVRTVNL